MSSDHSTRTQKTNLDKKYNAYLKSNGVPEDLNSNPLNIFDASNIKDKAYFKLAQTYMVYKKKVIMTKQNEEEFNVRGEDLVDKIKNLIQEGNIRRITIKSKEGKSIIEIPLTIGVVGAVISPVLAAVGAIAALITDCTITVQRDL